MRLCILGLFTSVLVSISIYVSILFYRFFAKAAKSARSMCTKVYRVNRHRFLTRERHNFDDVSTHPWVQQNVRRPRTVRERWPTDRWISIQTTPNVQRTLTLTFYPNNVFYMLYTCLHFTSVKWCRAPWTTDGRPHTLHRWSMRCCAPAERIFLVAGGVEFSADRKVRLCRCIMFIFFNNFFFPSIIMF
jgi:hypothetical protein